MDKQKQIEEMAKDRVAELRLFYNFCKYNGCEEKTAEDCENCYFRKVYNRLAELEGEIRNGTLKEIPENAVVLTEDNAEELGNMIVESPQMQKAMKNLIKEWRKEAAEKFAEKLKEKADYMDSYSCGKKGVFIKDIDEICKEFTEGEYGESLCEE